MTISTEFLRQGLIYDRYLGVDVDLPYTFEDIKIQPNDTATYSVLNIKFKHLYDNFLYLYKNCKLASNVIPISATAIAGVSASSNKFNNLCSDKFLTIG